MSTALTALRIPHQLQHATANGVLKVDVSVPREGTKPLALMLSGYGCFLQGHEGDRDVPTGPTRMETKMLAASWQVVRCCALCSQYCSIPYDRYANLRTLAGRWTSSLVSLTTSPIHMHNLCAIYVVP